MMTITLVAANNGSYVVDTLVNTIEPKIGTYLTEKEVENLIRQNKRGNKVIIKRK